MSAKRILILISIVIITSITVPADAGFWDFLFGKMTVDIQFADSSLTRPTAKIKNAVTTTYVQNRILQWALYQTISKPSLSESERFVQLINVIDRYVQQPATEYAPRSFEEAKLIIDKVLEAPLLVEQEMHRIFVDGDLPPRITFSDENLTNTEFQKIREYLVNAELKVTLKPLGNLSQSTALGGLFSSFSTLGQREYSLFELVAETSDAGKKFRKQLLTTGKDFQTKIVRQLVKNVDQLIDASMQTAEDRIQKIHTGDPITDRFLQVFMPAYMKALPRRSIVQIAAHLLRHGYPIEKLELNDLLRLMLERSDPTAVKVVQIDDSPQLREAFQKSQADASKVPGRFLRQELKDVTPKGATLTMGEDAIGAGSIAQVHRGQLNQNGHVIDVAIRFVKPGIRQLFDDAGPAIEAGIRAVESDAVLQKSRYAFVRSFIEQLRTLIAIEFDARETENRQIIARQQYTGEYVSEGWKVEFKVPPVYGQATNVAGIQGWVGPTANRHVMSFPTFNKNYPEQKEMFARVLMYHFFKMAAQGYVHGDLQMGNLNVYVDPKTMMIESQILDAGMFEPLSIEFRQAMFQLLMSLKLNIPSGIVNSLYSMQDQKKLDRSQLHEIVRSVLASNQSSGLDVIEILFEKLGENGYSTPLRAAGFFRSMVALNNLGVQTGHPEMLNLVFTDAIRDIDFIREATHVSIRTAFDVGQQSGRASVESVWSLGSKLSSHAAIAVGKASDAVSGFARTCATAVRGSSGQGQ